MKASSRAALGLDFGTESVRALLVDLDGRQLGSATSNYASGQILDELPTGELLPHLFALQDPDDWVSSATTAVRGALDSSGIDANSVIGIGVDFTSCTILPCREDGRPLCKLEDFQREVHAWPKLWKHHGAISQTQRINDTAHDRKEEFLTRYGGIIGLEWFFPKVLEVLEQAPRVYDATDVWLEAGDWFVWQLVDCPTGTLPRSTCQAGYKAMWSKSHGYPTRDFLSAVHPMLGETVHTKLPGRFVSPGECAGRLCQQMARRFGLRAETPVSAAVIDAHAGVPGAGVATDGTLVMVMGTSSCHMLNSKEECFVPGVAGVVENGILPGYFGYETGQAAVGDAFDWARRLFGADSHEKLTAQASSIPQGADGITCIDWMNGCRTPLMNGELSGAFIGLKLHHEPAHLYRAVLEASAYGMRWILECLRDAGVAVRNLVATGGLPHNNPALMQIYADILGEPVSIHPSREGPALGAAVLGALAAGSDESGFGSSTTAIETMAGPRTGDATREAKVVEPSAANNQEYEAAYKKYRTLAQFLNTDEEKT